MPSLYPHDSIPTSASLEGRLVADPVLQHTHNGKPFVQVRVEAEPRPQRLDDGTFTDQPAVECTLVVFDKAAERVARRFRFGDRFVASGRIKADPQNDRADAPLCFVARRIGHDAARTVYRVTRTRPAGWRPGTDRNRRRQYAVGAA